MRRGSKSKVAATGKNGKSSRATPTQPSGNGVKRSRQAALDEELDSGDSGDEEAAQHAAMLAGEAEDDEELKESAEERRVRLAKEMIAAMDAAAARRREGAADVSGVARGAHADEIAQELEEDAMRRAGQYRFLAAEQLRGVQLDPSASRVFRGPRLSATSVAVAPDESFVVCGCKDGALVRWDLQSGARTKLLGGRATALHGARAGGGGEHGDGAGTSKGNSDQTGHLSDVLSVVVSADSRLIASGGRDGAILLWDCRTSRVVHQMRGHKMPVSALSRRRDADGPELYSGCDDRTVRVWDVEQRGYVETLYGHQEPICALDALCEHHLLSGSADRTVRLWKVDEETQLVFTHGHTAPVDCVAMLHADAFVSGSQVRTFTRPFTRPSTRPFTRTRAAGSHARAAMAHLPTPAASIHTRPFTHSLRSPCPRHLHALPAHANLAAATYATPHSAGRAYSAFKERQLLLTWAGWATWATWAHVRRAAPPVTSPHHNL
jgi:ribosomal RNA-processing protein 9